MKTGGGAGGVAGSLRPLFLTSCSSPYSSRVARSTFVKRGRESTGEPGVLPTLSALNPALTPEAPPFPLPASVGVVLKAMAGEQVSPATSQRSSQATARTATAGVARTPENARPRRARGDKLRSEEPAHASHRS